MTHKRGPAKELKPSKFNTKTQCNSDSSSRPPGYQGCTLGVIGTAPFWELLSGAAVTLLGSYLLLHHEQPMQREWDARSCKENATKKAALFGGMHSLGALRKLFSSSRRNMQAIVVSALGDSSSLQLAESSLPVAGPGQALVKLEYSGVNYIDTYFRTGLYPTQLPYTPGAFAR